MLVCSVAVYCTILRDHSAAGGSPDPDFLFSRDFQMLTAIHGQSPIREILVTKQS